MMEMEMDEGYRMLHAACADSGSASTSQYYVTRSRFSALPTDSPAHGLIEKKTWLDRVKNIKKYWKTIKKIVSLIFGLCWLIPIISLFVVNITEKTIGAGAWCPAWTGCSVITYALEGDVSTFSDSQQHDIENHDLLGGLQFVIKALEVWYFFIATSLLWYVTILISQTHGGIPLAYFFTHAEFGDLLALKDRRLYGAANVPRSPGRRWFQPDFAFLRHQLFYFVFFVVLMCLTANVMGPSIAVLVLPTLSWPESPDQILSTHFTGYLAGQAPTGDSAIPGCNASDLKNQLYYCTTEIYGSALDALVAQLNQEDDQLFNNFSRPQYAHYAPSDTARPIEQSIPFSFNASMSMKNSTNELTVLAPSRQTLRDLSTDFQGLFEVINGTTSNTELLNQYGQYKNSFEIVLQRYGPVIGMRFFGAISKVTVTELGPNQSIHCYSGFEVYNEGSLESKCMRVGTAWNASNAAVGFSFDPFHETGFLPLKMHSYWSDRAIYTNSSLLNECFPDGSFPELLDECDYDALFAGAQNPQKGDQASDMFVVEYITTATEGDGRCGIFQVFPRYDFATYNIDVTSIYPSLPAVTVPNPPSYDDMQPIVVHPAWLLAAWSVKPNGSVPTFSDRSFFTQSTVNHMLRSHPSTIKDAKRRWKWYNLYAMAQAASLIPYTTQNLTSYQQQNPGSLPDNQPGLWSAVNAQAWRWSISSRTSKVGLTFCSIGILVTIARTVLMWILWKPEGSTLGLLTTAMRYHHRGELGSEEEADRARVRYKIVHREEEDEVEFEHVRGV